MELKVKIVFVLGLKFLAVTATSYPSIFTSFHCASPVLHIPRGTASQPLASKPLASFDLTFFLPRWTSQAAFLVRLRLLS